VRVIKPLNYWGIFGIFKVELNSFEGIHAKYTVAVVEWRLLVDEGG
jgi:hypothetical protein